MDIKCPASFVLGAAAGALVAWKTLEKKYDEAYQKDVESLKKEFRNKKTIIPDDPIDDAVDVTPKEEYDEDEAEKEDLRNYSSLLSREEYDNLAHKKEEKKVEEDDDEVRPYVISPEEFGENEEYPIIELIYFSDKVLTDDNYELVTNVDEKIGFDALNHFGEYEDDSVFVQNDEYECYYEIILDERRYSDVLKETPGKLE